MMRRWGWIALLFMISCGSDAAAGGGTCSSGGFWFRALILIAVVSIGYVLSNKAEANGDLLRSIYSDVKRLSRKMEELEEKLAESKPAAKSAKKSAKAGKDSD